MPEEFESLPVHEYMYIYIYTLLKKECIFQDKTFLNYSVFVCQGGGPWGREEHE